jgi:hypothetical protein
MAKKKVGKVQATAEPATKAIRLDMSPRDHERIEHVAKSLKVSKAAFARMAVMDRVRAEEARIKE